MGDNSQPARSRTKKKKPRKDQRLTATKPIKRTDDRQLAIEYDHV